jgi:hypothetical protein
MVATSKLMPLAATRMNLTSGQFMGSEHFIVEIFKITLRQTIARVVET